MLAENVGSSVTLRCSAQSSPRFTSAAPNTTSRNSQYLLVHTRWYLRPSLSATASEHKRTCSKAPLLPLYPHLQFRRMKGPCSPASGYSLSLLFVSSNNSRAGKEKERRAVGGKGIAPAALSQQENFE